MKLHMPKLRTAGAVPHPHGHSFFHRTHEHTGSNSWSANHLTLASWIITSLIGCAVIGWLIMFTIYQTTGTWPWFGG